MAERMASTAVPSQPVPDSNASAADYQAQAPPAAQPPPTEELLRTLKVTWDKRGTTSYSINQLRAIFSKHGNVEDVVQHTSKKRFNGSALVLMQTLAGAQAAGDAVNGSLPNPLLVLPLAKASASAPAFPDNSSRSHDHPSDIPAMEPGAYAPAAPAQEQQQHSVVGDDAPLEQSQPAQAPQQADNMGPPGPSDTPLTPPSSPMKPTAARNPFGGKLNPDEARGSAGNDFSSFAAFGTNNAAAHGFSNSAANIFGSTSATSFRNSNSAANIFGGTAANALNTSAASSFSSFPAFPSSPSVRPLFAAGSMNGGVGQSHVNPTFGAGSYSSFPGINAVGGQAQAAMQGAFAQVHAGAKR